MYREGIEQLRKWKDSRRRKPLMITGVRQCGKTYLIKQFAEQYFEQYVYLNFEEEERLSEIFEFDFDVKRILGDIEIATGQKIYPGETLLVLDEIQQCPRAITSLKYFCENMRQLHLICAGSFLGVAIKSENISFPVGKINRMHLYPMNFREFVIADGGERYIEAVTDWAHNRPLPELYAKPLEEYLKKYYIVGGMPEAVAEWSENHNYAAVDEILDEILEDYADDFSKHAPIREVEKIRWIWDSVPKQLAKENNKFVFSHVKEGKRSAELEDALQWLRNAGLIHILELATNIEIPLSSYADATYFKVYMSDVGLLRRKSGIAVRTILEGGESYRNFKGAIAENYVYGELKAIGIHPYFWRSRNTAELDFVFEEENVIYPVEVKAADNVRAKSYVQFCKKYQPQYGFKCSLKNIAENDCERTRTLSLPLYMLFDIRRYFI